MNYTAIRVFWFVYNFLRVCLKVVYVYLLIQNCSSCTKIEEIFGFILLKSFLSCAVQNLYPTFFLQNTLNNNNKIDYTLQVFAAYSNFLTPFIFATRWGKVSILQTVNSVRSNSQSWTYQRFTLSSCKSWKVWVCLISCLYLNHF